MVKLDAAARGLPPANLPSKLKASLINDDHHEPLSAQEASAGSRFSQAAGSRRMMGIRASVVFGSKAEPSRPIAGMIAGRARYRDKFAAPPLPAIDVSFNATSNPAYRSLAVLPGPRR